jgi:hypothetical protein
MNFLEALVRVFKVCFYVGEVTLTIDEAISDGKLHHAARTMTVALLFYISCQY